MSDKPLNDDINALDAEAAEANAEHGLDSRPSQDAGDDLAPLDAVIAERDEWKDRALRVAAEMENLKRRSETCLLYTSPSPRDQRGSRMPSSA